MSASERVDERSPSQGGAGGDGRIPFATPITVVFAAALLIYAGWAAFTGTGRFRAVRVGYGVDSAYYIMAAKAPVWSLKFLATPNGAPFLFSLLAKLCLRNLRVIVLVQSAFAVWAWWFLARTIAARLHRPAVRTLTFVAVLLLAASPPIVMWNVFVATESLSISLLCVASALWIRLTGGRPGDRDFTAFVVVLAALACTRDSYAVMLLVVAGIAIVVALARRALRQRAAIVAAVCIVASVLNIAASNHGGRWFDPLDETIAIRLLGSHEATQYFVDHGMPYDHYVRALHKPDAIVFRAHDVTYAPQFKRYRNWLLNKGRGTYTSYLLTHPVSDITGPFDDRRRLLRPEVRPYAHLYFVDLGGAGRVVGAIGMPSSQGLVEVWIGIAALGAAWLALKRRGDRALLIAAGLSTVLLVVHFLVAWHGDALELDRHIIAAAVELRVVLLIVSALLVDELLSVGKRPKAVAR